MKFPVSVFIIAKNEEDRIPQAIKSVIDWADEVLVIDSGSDDNTTKVSEELGARVVFNEWNGYGQQKIFGEKLCKHNWILNIDADEEVSPELAQELQQVLQNNGGEYQAYYLYIKLTMRGMKKPSIFSPRTDAIRFYNKNFAGFRNSTVHDSVIPKEGHTLNIGKLKGTLYHKCFRSLRHAVEKINYYTDMQAIDLVEKEKYPSSIRIICEPLIAFMKAYILRRYFLYGINGFIEGILYAFNRTLRLAKARELFDKSNNTIL